VFHEPAAQSGKDYGVAYKTRLGVWMFLYYTILYVGFVAINLLAPNWMEKIVFGGLNLATVYGFGLIIIALIQALIYSAMCSKQEALLKSQDKSGDNK